MRMIKREQEYKRRRKVWERDKGVAVSTAAAVFASANTAAIVAVIIASQWKDKRSKSMKRREEEEKNEEDDNNNGNEKEAIWNACMLKIHWHNVKIILDSC